MTVGLPACAISDAERALNVFVSTQECMENLSPSP